MIPRQAVDVLASFGAAFIFCTLSCGLIGAWIGVCQHLRRTRTPAPGPRSMPGAGPAPGEGHVAGLPGTSADKPSPGSCRWCDGTGIAIVFDALMEDAYPIPCPGACPEPGRQL